MKERLVIIGASGHGKVVADIALKLNRWREVVFLDDNESLKESLGLRVVGTSADALKFVEDSDLFVAIGSNPVRERFQSRLVDAGASVPVLVHPSAVIGSEVIIGDGSVVMAGVVVNCCTRIGLGCIINTGATVDHDCCIEDFVHISPGVNLAGSVLVGNRSWLGIGSKVINNINITGNCNIGAGSLVVKDITDSGLYFGAPVRKKI